MKKKITKFVGLLIYLSILNGCNYNSGKKAEESTSDTTNLKKLVADWNKAHSSKDVGVFSSLFDNSILYYGVQQDKNTCIESKLVFFKKYPDFYQQIYGDIQIEKINDKEVKCSFVKRVTVKQATSDYPSYLTFKKYTDNWRIVTEGDLVTYKNLAKKSTTIQTEKLSNDKAEVLSAEFLGNYHGIQPSYFMKNQYGNDMVINGNKVSVPSIDYKFLLKDGNVVSLQQINLEDNSSVYFYDGTYKIFSQENNFIKIECTLSDGQGSSPSYILTINRSDKKGICTGNNEPGFSIEKK